MKIENEIEKNENEKLAEFYGVMTGIHNFATRGISPLASDRAREEEEAYEYGRLAFHHARLALLDQFQGAAESFVADAPSITDVRILRERFAPVNLAICGGDGIAPLAIPPSKWPVCDAVIGAYKSAFMRLI